MSDIIFQPLGKPVPSGKDLDKDKLADIDPRLTRTHYFDGRLLTAEDLTRDQIYLDQRLRELGRVLGSGIISGLQLDFDRFKGELTLKPGLAMTPAGRVLELDKPLTVNLRDSALISTLNEGNHSRLSRGLYAVVLRYIDVGTDIAEVFPKDLGAKRGFQYAMISESVQMGLVPLPIPLPQQSALQIRARLMRELLGDDQLHGLLPEDAVALGLVVIQEGAPQWLDAELLRHSLRAEPGIDSLQSDLSRQYESLLKDILAERRSGSLTGDFHASDYFTLIPPAGTLPKEAVDPVSGRQGYFPENYQIAIAPVRQADVELIRAESLALPPIDLSNGEPVDIVVLVPLSNLDYGYYAGKLERDYDPSKRLLPQLDLLRLKLYPLQPVHALDTDQAAWQAIWDRFGSSTPLYVRRPSRAAETSISGIVLALGTALPAPPVVVPGPADGGGLIDDEETVFLKRVNYAMFAETRPPVNDAGRESLDTLIELFSYPFMVAFSLRILLLVERHYDAVIWQTLQQLADSSNLEAMLQALQAKADGQTTGELVIERGPALGLDNELLNQWAALLP